MSKKSWLDYLYYKKNKQRDYLVCGLRKIGEKVIPTKWVPYSAAVFPVDINEDWKLNWINQRQILAGEVVVDLEERAKLQPALDKLRAWKVEAYVYDTGSRGYHIDIFFDRDLSQSEKLEIIKTLGGDEQKASQKTLISLEFCPHWKSGKIKELVEWK